MADSVRVDTEVVRAAGRQAQAAGRHRCAGLEPGAAERLRRGIGGGEYMLHREVTLARKYTVLADAQARQFG